MATIYSLVCWGGRTGKTVSLSATTDVVTLANHGLRNGTKLWPSGTLPSELNTSTPVYARSTAANTFTLHTSSAGAIANTGQITIAGSSTYVAVVLKSDLVADPANSLAAYGLSDLSRWGASGSERIYDGLEAFYSARSAAASAVNDEFCELGESFLNYLSNQVVISANAATWTISSTINGVRTPAFHYGVIYAGFTAYYGAANNSIIQLNSNRCTLDGFTCRASGSGANLNLIYATKPYAVIKKMVSVGYFVSTGSGIILGAPAIDVIDCLAMGTNVGIYPLTNNLGLRILNCISVGNLSGIATNNTSGLNVDIYNTISVGNTTNWPTGFPTTASNNAGLSNGSGGYTGGTPLGVSPFAVTSANFANYAGSGTAPVWTTVPDFRPTSGAPQIDSGTQYSGILSTDISGNERPNYNNGGAEYYDVGAYEFDHGYGPRPASTTVTFSGVNAGSEIRVYDSAANELAGVETSSANPSMTWTIPIGAVRIVIIHPDYKIKEFAYTSVVGNQSLPVQQEPDKWYSNPL